MLKNAKQQGELLITVLSSATKEQQPERPEVEPAPSELEVSGEAGSPRVRSVNADFPAIPV